MNRMQGEWNRAALLGRRKASRHSRPLALICVLVAASFTLPSQTVPSPADPPPADTSGFTLKAFSRITLVDVTVTDGKGQPVHGLQQNAFTVFEDGKPQPIRSFGEIGKETPLVTRVPPKLPPHVYTNLQPAPSTSAVNVLLLDSLNTSPADQMFVKQETLTYLKSMAPGTRIAVMGLSNKLRLLQGFTTDPAILVAAVDTKKNRALPSPFLDTDSTDATNQMMDLVDADTAAGLQEFQNEQTAFQTDVRNRMTLEALNQIAAYLSGIKGRKNLIWFTGGVQLQLYPQGGMNDLASMTDYTKDVRKTTDLLTASQIAVYPVDARGVVTNPGNNVTNPPTGFANGRGDSMAKSTLAFSMKMGQEHLAMETVAEATGGVAYYNTNGLKEAVRNAIDNGQNYYTLSYVPPNPAYDGAFHTISVKANIPGIHLAYRKGYYADDIARNAIKPGLTLATTAPEPYGSNMQASMGRGVPTSSQLLFSVRVEPEGDAANPPGAKVLGTLDPKLQGKPLHRYDLQYSLPGRQVTLNDGPDAMRKGSLQFDIAAYDVYGKVISSLSQTIDLSLTEERYQLLQKKPFQLVQGIDLPAGEIFLRLGILDRTSDKTGTLEIPLSVPRKSPPSATAVKNDPEP